MTGLALRALRGVRRSEASLDECEAQAAALGWRCIVLDTGEAEDKTALLEVCARAFALPEWFGRNWDALDEALGDLDLSDSQGVAVLWTGWEPLAEAEPAHLATALEVLADAARGWARDGVRGGVLVLGDGPAISLLEVLRDEPAG